MTRGAAVLGALLAATPAAALTCAPPDALATLREVRAAPEAFAVLHGTFAFDASAMPGLIEGPPDGPPLGAPDMLADPVPARFDGVAFAPDGSRRPFAGEVTLRPRCLGPWCGGMEPGTWLAFAAVSADGLGVDLDPCAAHAFADPPADVLDALSACLRDGSGDGACGP